MRNHRCRTPWMPGLFLAILALVSQVALAAPGAAPMPAWQTDGPGVLCHSDASDAAPAVPAPHRHAPDCALCPLCVAHATPGAILAGGPVLPAAGLVPAPSPPPRPPSRAPPVRPLPAAFPRGPPAIL